ncbi:kinase-like domain-containing protein [Suillus spraguei]|nr:kinase-like domain-containing protein [Suillus spraguei]
MSHYPQVAVKAIRSFFSDAVLRKELEIWKRLQHFNILKFMGTTQAFGPSEALVAPWIVNGDLTSFLKRNNDALELRDRLLLLRDVASGLNYFHTFSVDVNGQTYLNAVIHGDLTGTNVLVDGDRRAYLADFGLSGTLAHLPGMTYLEKMGCHPGALRWTALELFSAEESASAHHTSRKLPWSHLTRNYQRYQVIFKRKKHPRPADDRVTDQHWNFMTLCWSKEPDACPSAGQALQFVDSELILYEQGSVDGGQHLALVSVI